MVGPEVPPFPRGASLFADAEAAPLTGQYHRLPHGTELPPGFGVIPDGLDVHPNSLQPPGHHTLFPIVRMPFSQFEQGFDTLPWQYVGNKKKKK